MNRTVIIGMAAAAAVFLTSCARFSPEDIGPEGAPYPTLFGEANGLGIWHNKAYVNKQVDTQVFRPLLYVRANLHASVSPYRYRDELMQQIKQHGFFDKVVTREASKQVNTEQFIKPTLVGGNPWYDMTDSLTLGQLRQRYRPQRFLIADCTLSQSSVNRYELKRFNFTLKLIDSRDGTTLFIAHNHSTGYSIRDVSVMSPVLQAAWEWLSVSDQSQFDFTGPFVPKQKKSTE